MERLEAGDLGLLTEGSRGIFGDSSTWEGGNPKPCIALSDGWILMKFMKISILFSTKYLGCH